jgi:hypothetical protein
MQGQTAKTAETCLLPSWCPDGSCRSASFCGHALVVRLVEVLLSLLRVKRATEDTLASLFALNPELADQEAKAVQLAPLSLPVWAGEAAKFMSKDCVTVREGEGG